MLVGFLDGVTANMIRSGKDGGRYYAPFGRRGAVYRIPDDATATRITRDWQTFTTLIFSLIFIVGPISGAGWKLFLLVPVVAIAIIPFAFWTGRGLKKAPFGAEGLTTVSRSQAFDQYSRATGSRWLGFLLTIGVLLTGLGIFAAIRSGEIKLWLAAGFFALCTVSIAMQLRRARPRSGRS